MSYRLKHTPKIILDLSLIDLPKGDIIIENKSIRCSNGEYKMKYPYETTIEFHECEFIGKISFHEGIYVFKNCEYKSFHGSFNKYITMEIIDDGRNNDENYHATFELEDSYVTFFGERADLSKFKFIFSDVGYSSVTIMSGHYYPSTYELDDEIVYKDNVIKMPEK